MPERSRGSALYPLSGADPELVLHTSFDLCYTDVWKGVSVKLSKYRITAGEYQVGDYMILWGGPGHWQLRDHCDEIIECLQTLREALELAIRFGERA